jgi:hypothetical protein
MVFKCDVSVNMEQSDVTKSTITTDPLLTGLLFLIDGLCKNNIFAYVYHSSFPVNENGDPSKTLKLLLIHFVKDLKKHMTKKFRSTVTIEDFKRLRLFFGGGSVTTRKAERDAIYLLINLPSSTVTSSVYGRKRP